MKRRPQALTHWNDSEVLEAIRLLNKFFPESKGFVGPETGLDIYRVIDSMKLAPFQVDSSCDPFDIPPGPDLGLQQKGGFEGDHTTIYSRLLEHTGFVPSGRCVIIPDTLGQSGWSAENVKPIICDSRRAAERIAEYRKVFNKMHDIILVYESGEVIVIDHDNRVCWAKSKRNRYQKTE